MPSMGQAGSGLRRCASRKGFAYPPPAHPPRPAPGCCYGEAREGGGHGNVTLHLCASTWLRGPPAAGDLGPRGGATQARPWTPARGAEAPGAFIVRGSVFSQRGLGSFGTAPRFSSLLPKDLWFWTFKK